VLGKRGEESWADAAENSVHVSKEQFLVFSRSLTGDSGFILAVAKNKDVESLLRALLNPQSPTQSIKAPVHLEGSRLADVLEVLRIEAGIVRMGVDAPEGKLVLPETGLEQQVVSYSKGCYLGQEVIARIRTYGSVPNVLRGLVIESPKLETGVDSTEHAEVWKLETILPD